MTVCALIVSCSSLTIRFSLAYPSEDSIFQLHMQSKGLNLIHGLMCQSKCVSPIKRSAPGSFIFHGFVGFCSNHSHCFMLQSLTSPGQGWTGWIPGKFDLLFILSLFNLHNHVSLSFPMLLFLFSSLLY